MMKIFSCPVCATNSDIKDIKAMKGKTIIGTCGDCQYYDHSITQIDLDNCELRSDFWFEEDGCIHWKEKK